MRPGSHRPPRCVQPRKYARTVPADTILGKMPREFSGKLLVLFGKLLEFSGRMLRLFGRMQRLSGRICAAAFPSFSRWR